MKLVTILLLLCVHTADLTPPECKGAKDQVVFCATGNSLKIPSPAAGYTWQFGTPDGVLPSELTPDDTTKDLKGSLEAKHTGVYLAVKTTELTDKFTIIVDAVECTKDVQCQVGTGSSIKLNSNIDGAKWEFESLALPTSGEPPKFTDQKKALGLFDVKAAQSGTYKAEPTGGGTAVEFPVVVSDKTRVSTATVKKGVGCVATLECEVTGDAQKIKWTKDGTDLTLEGKTLTVDTGDAGTGTYACKVLGYHGGAPVTSATFRYTYAGE
ncbi:uncharacterized protein LOC119129190 [Syngnathus acus]|uniref:uncharacterized protein LOC119129190 n=1 Tax=Syngnathus acus TaxID=161584 RepID=UPI001885D2F1|nr:uncharacterized protein LOC119129190 [Syngnathus acus]